jgi:DNA primase
VEQIRLIKRYTSHLVLLYDGDPAGIQASFRGIDLLLKEGINVQIVLLPDNHDPDSFARTHDEAELQTFLQENAQDFVFFKAQIFLKETKNNPAEKSQKIKDIIQSIAYISDSITRELYLKECSSIFDMDLSILWAELNNSLILHQKQTDREHANREHANRGHANHLEIESKYSEKQILSVENSENISANELAKPENLTEAELIKALLLYGSQWIHLKKEDQTITIPLAWYLVLEIESDELTFEDDVFQRIYLVYKTASENKENVPVENHFIHHTDLEIQQVAVGFFSFPHSVSENWKKFQVYPTAIEKKLEEYSTWLVTRFKYEKVQNLLKKTMAELKKTLEEEEIDKLMKKLTLLNNLKKHFAALLGIVAHHISFRN